MRISTTTLESFRLWSQPDQDWMTEASLQATIRGEFVPTPQVRLGLAFGKVLEQPWRYETLLGYVFDDAGYLEYQFSRATLAPALALMDHQRGVFEAKATREYGDCTVVARADQMVGGRLYEHKTTTGSFDFEKYAASYQWRFMVDIFQPLSVTYHVFLLDDHENGVVELKGIESFTLYPYAALHQDCCDLLERFCVYVKARGLDGVPHERADGARARESDSSRTARL